jgi:hypothetical protein
MDLRARTYTDALAKTRFANDHDVDSGRLGKAWFQHIADAEDSVGGAIIKLKWLAFVGKDAHQDRRLCSAKCLRDA